MPPRFLAFLAALASPLAAHAAPRAAAPAPVAGRHDSAPRRLVLELRGAAVVGTLVRLAVNSPFCAGEEGPAARPPYRMRNDLPAALEWYKKALAVDPNFGDAYHDMARLRGDPAYQALLEARL